MVTKDADCTPVFLVGLMGAGKSTLGRELAEATQREFIDLDTEVESALQQCIASYVIQNGEHAFRTAEHTVFQQFCMNRQGFRGTVVACGGGFPCFFNHMFSLNILGKTIWLDVPMAELAKRLFGQHTTRPLTANATDTAHLAAILQALYVERLPCYAQAQIRISGSNVQAEELTAAIKPTSKAN